MADITVTFDPDRVHTQATIAEKVGTSTANTRYWINSNREYLPEPLFKMEIGSGRRISVWRYEDGEIIANHYANTRSMRRS